MVDDCLRIKPYQKLIGQIAGASLVILGGLTLPWTPWAAVNMALTIFWLVGITNAVNLLDNMDGLAAGVSAISAAFLAATFAAADQPAEAALLAAFAAALLGFLAYNFHPASIFMGDCGSLFVGFFLAGTSLLNVSTGRSRSLVSVLAVPVLLLLIPIFDTTLVTVVRKLSRRAVSQGGRDHSSHRLVALGLSERRAVGLLYALAAVSGLVAFLVREAPLDVCLLSMAAVVLPLTLLGTYLADVKIYTGDLGAGASRGPVMAFLVDLSYKRRVFEVLLDVALIGLAYYSANVLYFGPLGDERILDLFLNIVPALVLLKLMAFLVAGVYRGLWRYVTVSDLVVYVKGVVLGSALSVLALLLLFRFEGFSRTVFVLDGLFLFLLVTSSRLAFRLLRNLLRVSPVVDGRRVLIFGAGDAGVLLLREMRNNPQLGCVPVGFGDDDPGKQGKVIQGLRVLGGNGSLQTICRQQRIEELFISSSRIPVERVREILRECGELGIGVKRLRIDFETLCLGNDMTDNADVSPAAPSGQIEHASQRDLIPTALSSK
jgi:UDP-GlcNAc:undecaprenyl-phosphate GlcNAc-1-phosphate transferase